MISSMTGFGRGSSSTETKRIIVEIKSLNSKQLDLTFRMPSNFREMEIMIRPLIASRLKRGKVEVVITVEALAPETNARLDTGLLSLYKKQLEDLGKELNLPEPEDWYSLLLRMPDSIKYESQNISEAEKDALFSAFDEALNNLIVFRNTEGEKLEVFFKNKIKNIQNLLSQIERYEPERVTKIRGRIEDQLRKLKSVEYDQGRLEQEMIFYIEKLDVTEEKVRLDTHMKYFLETMDKENPETTEGSQGKKLGFIAQEMGREINTLGSKSNQAEMQKIVVEMKDELEQIKEQVLNVL